MHLALGTPEQARAASAQTPPSPGAWAQVALQEQASKATKKREALEKLCKSLQAERAGFAPPASRPATHAIVTHLKVRDAWLETAFKTRPVA